MSEHTFFIGTNFGHSAAAACLNEDGELIFAVEEERLIKEKHTEKFPEKSIQFILSQIPPGNKIVWSEGWNIYQRFLFKGLFHSIRFWKDRNYFKIRFQKELQRLQEGLKRYSSFGKFNYTGHHLAHAYSLLPYGLPRKSLVFVSDTMGERESISFYYWDGKMKWIKSIPYPHSLGSIYHQFSFHLGFKGRTGPGKLMALSGYGRPKWINEFNKITEIKNGDLRIDLRKYPVYRIKDAPDVFYNKTSNKELKEVLLQCKNNYEAGLDIAAALQEWFTQNTWELLRQNVEHFRNYHKLEVEHVGLAGGSALNCQTNGYIARKMSELNIDSLVISPWSEDAGTAIGSAVHNFLLNNPERGIKKVNAFLGPTATLRKKTTSELQNDVQLAADAILNGQLISLVSGRIEFGPRALGGRCIIGSAFDKKIVYDLNHCKSRPQFMPFAPAVLEEDYSSVFDDIGSDNMTWTVKVKEGVESIIPAAIHITKEARVQVVREDNVLIFSLLKRIKQLRKIGIVLLTSLNGAGETMPVYYDDAKEVSQKLKLAGILSDIGWEYLN